MRKKLIGLGIFYLFLCGTISIFRAVIGFFLDRELRRGDVSITKKNKASAIGIIGGVDGPTTVFVAGRQYSCNNNCVFPFLLQIYASLASLSSIIGFGALYNVIFRAIKKHRRIERRKKYVTHM